MNVVQPHPSQPLTLATSGLDDTVKVWTPSAAEAEPPGLDALERMQRNKAEQGRSPHDMFTLEEMQELLFVQHRGGGGAPGSGDDSDYAGGGYGSSEEDEGGGGGPPEQCALM